MREGVLLVGLGAIGMGYDLSARSDQRVTTHARAFTMENFFGSLSAVDSDSYRRRQFDESYGAPSYETIAAAIAQQRPRIVIIATPTHSHATILNQVLERSTPEAVLCEKPLAHDPIEAELMVEACGRSGVKLFVNYMRRADPGVIEVRDMIRLKKLEPPVKGVVWYSKGLIHNGSHFVDLMRFWFGSVRRTCVIRVGRRLTDEDSEPDFLLDFDAAEIAFFAAKEESFSHYTAELVSQNGRLRYEAGGTQITWQEVIDDPDCEGYRVLQRSPQLIGTDMARCQLNVVRQLGMALAERPSTLCTGAEGLHALRNIYQVRALL